MIRNYLLITLRNFWRNPNYSLINILGLSVGVSACILVFLVVSNELKFDKFHSKYSSIYRIVGSSTSASGEEFSSATPYPLVAAFRNDFPEVPLATQLHYQTDVMVQLGDKKFLVDDVAFVDSLFFEVFDFEVVSGNPLQALGEPGQFFLTESLAKTMGITSIDDHIRLKIDNFVEGEVVGIVKDPPQNSHIQFAMVVPYASFSKEFLGGIPYDHWGVTASSYAYFVLPDKVSASSIENRFPEFIKKYYKKEDAKDRKFSLQPLSKIHFDELYTENPYHGHNASMKELTVMMVLGAFILIIGSINFVNLSTALAIKKSKEIGIRKTLGAGRIQLSVYFLLETFLITGVAVLISLGALEWLLPFINSFLGKSISINLFTDYQLIIFLFSLMMVTTLLSGIYPALILSGYNPAVILKSKVTAQHTSGGRVRQALVVCQFIIAQVLIIATLVVSDQMYYFKNKPLGFDKEAVIQVPLPENDEAKLKSFRERLETEANIKNISFSLGAPTSENSLSTGFFLPETPDVTYPVKVKAVDFHYKETYGITIKAGRWFTEAEEKMASTTLPEDQRKYVFVINESAVKRLGFQSAEEVLGKNIKVGINDSGGEVVGVVNDFHVSSLHNEIMPVVLMNFPAFFYSAGFKVNTTNLSETISFIEKNWNNAFPDYYFKYSFLDQELEALYRDDERTFTLMKVLSLIAIFIGCLGLYGLVSFMANQKLKEVGVRKVMGASVFNIVLLFSSGFMRLILIAFLVAAPIGWYFMNEWLQGFAYHIDVHWSVFAISIFATIVITLATVSYRSIKAALANPSETLRTE